MVKYEGVGDIIFRVFNYLILSLAALSCLLPFIHIFVSSFTSAGEILQKGFVLIPEHPTLSAYKQIFSTRTFVRSLGVSAFVTVAGTGINMVMTVMMAYALAYKPLVGRKVFNFLVLFTMLFGGGMIPTYLVVRDLKLLDTFWALMIPGAISSYNMIIVRNAFSNTPVELAESARIDGANDALILVRIVLPITMPTLAAIALFYAVGHWNSYFTAILYINDPKKWPIQVLLRSLVILTNGAIGSGDELDSSVKVPTETMQMATIIVATLPILILYPFLQKYFAKGALIGSIKG
ncbi:MAG: carbohydrate ABC transporter permease [Christensenellales bacterium]